MKRKAYFDAVLASLKTFNDPSNTIDFRDSSNISYLTRELEGIRKKVFERRYRPIRYRELIPLSVGGGLGVDSLITEVRDKVGKAAFINAGTDIPQVSITRTEGATPVRVIGAMWETTIFEIAKAQLAGTSLNSRKATACGEVMQTELNDVAWFGSPDNGLKGFLEGPADYVVSGATANDRLWVNKTPREILNDINEVFIRINEESDDAYEADTLLLPVAQYNYIDTTPVSDNNDMSIKNWIISNSSFLNGPESIQRLSELREAFGTVANPVNGMVAYAKNEEYVTMHIPQDVMTLPPHQQHLSFQNIMLASTGGVEWVVPESARIVTGI